MGTEKKEIDPHLFKMAEEAFQAMKANTMNQEIVVSGISGAGKTEAAKLMLAYLANACNNFKYLDTGEDIPAIAGSLFEDSLTESENSEEEEQEEAKDDIDDMFAQFDDRITSNRSAVAIDLRQSVDVMSLMEQDERNHEQQQQ